MKKHIRKIKFAKFNWIKKALQKGMVEIVMYFYRRCLKKILKRGFQQNRL